VLGDQDGVQPLPALFAGLEGFQRGEDRLLPAEEAVVLAGLLAAAGQHFGDGHRLQVDHPLRGAAPQPAGDALGGQQAAELPVFVNGQLRVVVDQHGVSGGGDRVGGLHAQNLFLKDGDDARRMLQQALDVLDLADGQVVRLGDDVLVGALMNDGVAQVGEFLEIVRIAAHCRVDLGGLVDHGIEAGALRFPGQRPQIEFDGAKRGEEAVGVGGHAR